jgi:hypothetical protein
LCDKEYAMEVLMKKLELLLSLVLIEVLRVKKIIIIAGCVEKKG